MSSVNDHDDLPLDIPELPDVPHFPPHITDGDLVEKKILPEPSYNVPITNESVERLAETVAIPQADKLSAENELPHHPPPLSQSPPPFLPPPSAAASSSAPPTTTTTTSNSETEHDSKDPEPLRSEECTNEKDVSKISISPPQSLENSSCNDHVCRSESPPSLVFSAESLNCDDNRCDEDFDDFQQNVDDIECSFPSLKLDSISDTKSQSSDSDEAINLPECEVVQDGDEAASVESSNLDDGVVVEKVEPPSDLPMEERSETVIDDGFDDFVEYEAHAADPCDFSKTSADEFVQCKETSDENAFAADFSQFEAFTDPGGNNSQGQWSVAEPQESDEQLPIDKPTTIPDTTDDFNAFDGEDDDDEFGEFSDFNDFSQTQTFASPLTANVEELTAKIKPLLDSLFPSSDNESEDGSYDALDITNDTMRIIRDFENSKALDHQWTSSVGKNSLVTALGIDSRNIVSCQKVLSYPSTHTQSLLISFLSSNSAVRRKMEQFNASVCGQSRMQSTGTDETDQCDGHQQQQYGNK